MLETLAATWWLWLLLSLLSFLAVGINSLLLSYGTAIDIAGLAYQATKLKREDLPPNPLESNKEDWKEWGGKTAGVVKSEAAKRAKGFVIEKATRKARKVFFSIVLFGFGVINAILFIASVIIALTLTLLGA